MVAANQPEQRKVSFRVPELFGAGFKSGFKASKCYVGMLMDEGRIGRNGSLSGSGTPIQAAWGYLYYLWWHNKDAAQFKGMASGEKMKASSAGFAQAVVGGRSRCSLSDVVAFIGRATAGGRLNIPALGARSAERSAERGSSPRARRQSASSVQSRKLKGDSDIKIRFEVLPFKKYGSN